LTVSVISARQIVLPAGAAPAAGIAPGIVMARTIVRRAREGSDDLPAGPFATVMNQTGRLARQLLKHRSGNVACAVNHTKYQYGILHNMVEYEIARDMKGAQTRRRSSRKGRRSGANTKV
jgi:hypothetical protein